ncbi:hypothetical protein EJD97_017921 [Solanum chilense]|uniref:Uncharacterized protein n=1 Tax=Solanum chilense TaxID=4083 RepID=A0A6N2AFW2_SOLCI|nr:hypothetical protein EJD97_017921 [Solanum chilense]
MNTRTNVTRRLEEEVAYAVAPPHDDKVLPLDENANVDQDPAKPPPMTEEDMRAILTQKAQSMTTQAQPATVQAQATTPQANRDVAPRPHKKVTTMASRQRDFTRMNPPTFYGSKVDEDPKNSLMRSTNSICLS